LNAVPHFRVQFVAEAERRDRGVTARPAAYLPSALVRGSSRSLLDRFVALLFEVHVIHDVDVVAQFGQWQPSQGIADTQGCRWPARSFNLSVVSELSVCVQ